MLSIFLSSEEMFGFIHTTKSTARIGASNLSLILLSHGAFVVTDAFLW